MKQRNKNDRETSPFKKWNTIKEIKFFCEILEKQFVMTSKWALLNQIVLKLKI